MTDFSTVKKNLETRGFQVSTFQTAAEAADYLNAAMDGVSVGFGGSITLDQMGLYEKLRTHNDVVWHWKTDDKLPARYRAMTTDMYVTSVNGLAETGELVNIDGIGNRVAGTLFGHRKVWFVVGRNKLAPTYEEALWRARNIAAPKNAQKLHKKTPCAVRADRCYDCKSPDRICRDWSSSGKPFPAWRWRSSSSTKSWDSKREGRRTDDETLDRSRSGAVPADRLCALLERSYSTAEPHSSKYWESEAAGTLRAENNQDIVNDLLILIGQHTAARPCACITFRTIRRLRRPWSAPHWKCSRKRRWALTQRSTSPMSASPSGAVTRWMYKSATAGARSRSRPLSMLQASRR